MSSPDHWRKNLEDDANSFGEDIIHNLNLLVYKGHVAYAAFLCPSTGNKTADRTNDDPAHATLPANNDFGFFMRTVNGAASAANPSGKWYMDYGYHMGYLAIDWNVTQTNQSSNIINQAGLTDNLDGGFVIMADAPKGTSEAHIDRRPSNSWNHNNEVVMGLTASSSVKKITYNPEYMNVGGFLVDGDEIYTAQVGKTSPTATHNADAIFATDEDPNNCTPKADYDQSIYHPSYYVTNIAPQQR